MKEKNMDKRRRWVLIKYRVIYTWLAFFGAIWVILAVLLLFASFMKNIGVASKIFHLLIICTILLFPIAFAMPGTREQKKLDGIDDDDL
jgi:uncharacterized membrane protein YkgB